MVGKIAAAIGEFFGFAKEHEKAKNVNYYQRTIKRQARAIEAAEQYILTDDPKLQEKYKKRFFKFNQ